MEQVKTKKKMTKVKKEKTAPIIFDGKKMNKFSREDYAKWKEFRNNTSNEISHKEYILLCELHAYYFDHKYYKPSKCCGQKTLNKWITDLTKIYGEGL